MPMIDADGCLLNVSVDGRDDEPTLMLSNSLGCTLEMWEPQMKTKGNASLTVNIGEDAWLETHRKRTQRAGQSDKL